MKNILIVGGGITGLAAAYIAAKQGNKVTVIEASETFGGLLNTFEIGGNRLEYYYHHFFTHDKELRWLLKELGIEDKLHFHEATMGVFRGGKFYDFNTPMDLLKFKPMSIIDKVRFGLTSLFIGKLAKWEEYENVSALQWFYKYAGKGATDSLWKPMLDIKFGKYANVVPMTWMVGRLRQRMNSRKKGDEKLGYLEGSLHTLLVALVSKLKELNVELVTKSPVTSLTLNNRSIKEVVTPNATYTPDQVLFTIPSDVLSNVIRTVDSELADKIGEVKYFGAVCTILETKKPLSSIYWLNVADEGYPFGGIIEHTNLIPSSKYQGKNIVYLSRYFALDEPLATMSDQEIESVMVSPLSKIYPGFDASWVEKVHIFKTRTAATVCDLNFSKKVIPCKLPFDNAFMANMVHIYPDERSTNNAIRVAAEACKKMGVNADEVPYGVTLSGKLGFN